MGGYDKNPGKLGAAPWVAILVLAGVGFAGWKLYQRRAVGDGNATLECSLRIETSQADCYATFVRTPASGDTTDVRVELDGQTLAEPASFDWAYLAPQDQRQGALKSTEPPPLGRQLRWRMPLKLVGELTPSIGDFIVHARLFWAGRPQDLARFSTKVVYNPK